MRVLVDTSVWSLSLRRNAPSNHASAKILADLIRDGRVEMMGAIRQELLSGVRSEKHFEALRQKLRSFPDLPLETEDHELAADFFNRCRGRGVQGSNTDFLICAVVSRREMAILTTDRDFFYFAEHIPVRLVSTHGQPLVDGLSKRADSGMSTDEILALTRDPARKQ